MKDLTSPVLIYVKGLLFLVLGFLASLLLYLQLPTLKVAAFLVLAICSFCRAYYFAFYVIERYIDPSYRFSGLLSYARYLFRRNR